MSKKITALFVILTVCIGILSPSIHVIAESTVFHDMDDYRMRHNLNGSVTVEFSPDIEILSLGAGEEETPEGEETGALFKSEFASVFMPGRALMTLNIGDGRITFTPIMLEGLVTIIEEEEPETADEDENEPFATLAPEESETSTEALEEETDASTGAEEPTEAATPEPTEVPDETAEPTEVQTADPTEEPTAAPTAQITPEPTAAPTPQPTEQPIPEPTKKPEEETTGIPEDVPAPELEAKGRTFRDVLLGIFGIQTAHAEEEDFAEDTAAEQPASPSRGRGRGKTFRNPGRNRTIAGSGSGSKDAESKQMRYDGLFDEVTDVILTGSEDKVKEDIIIRQYLGSHVFAYQVYTEGLELVQMGSEVYIYDEEAEHAATILAPYMYDATGIVGGGVGVSLSGGGGSYRLTYTPNDAWLADPARVYPVTVDPPVSLNTSYGDTFFDKKSISLYDNSSQMVTFTLPAPLLAMRGSTLVQNASLTTHNTFENGTGDCILSYLLENGESIPLDDEFIDTAIGRDRGDISWRVGLAIADVLTENSTATNIRFVFSLYKQSGGRDYVHFTTGGITMSVTYIQGVEKPNVTETVFGNGINSGTGYVSLSWPKGTGIVANAIGGYKVYLHNGYQYEEIAKIPYPGPWVTTCTYTTQGKKLWPTTAQINSGQYKVRLDGAGGDLAMLPTPVYNNAPMGSTPPQDNTCYYFMVVAYGIYNNTLDPEQYAWKKAIRLPDTMPPSAPTSVIVTAKDANNITVTWNGIEDLTPKGKVTILEGGQIQYSLDSQTNWISTGKNTGSGSFDLNSASLSEGSKHTIYIRGIDANGNYGAWMSKEFTVDRTPPTTPTVTLDPGTWTNGQYITVQWSGLTDNDAVADIQVRAGSSGEWKTTGSTSGSGAVSLDTSTFSQGQTTIYVRGIDRDGNVGTPGTAIAYTDRNGYAGRVNRLLDGWQRLHPHRAGRVRCAGQPRVHALAARGSNPGSALR
ncbi:MAG: hypothetical protein FWF69_09860, partial [Firmicutes bacterium]|nr:hypothetical protein [Bacillota bacterium]